VIPEAATIDILYVAFNRLEMTRESFGALLRNTHWDHVDTLYVVDDASTDGTSEWLYDQQMLWKSDNGPQADYGTDFILSDRKLGGPVAAMNWYLDATRDQEHPDTFAKIDNDFVVCPGWMDIALRLHYLGSNIDIIGFEPMSGRPQMVRKDNHAEWRLNEANHIGGKGLIRKRAFERSGCRPHPHGKHGYQGFTQWQRKHPDVIKAWISPDLCCFGLDQLPFEPWNSLTTSYVQKRWQRRWGPYDSLDTTYWQWWLDEDESRMAA
jgi:glycosyltransferase involved in cell wall biosynthesis